MKYVRKTVLISHRIDFSGTSECIEIAVPEETAGILWIEIRKGHR